MEGSSVRFLGRGTRARRIFFAEWPPGVPMLPECALLFRQLGKHLLDLGPTKHGVVCKLPVEHHVDVGVVGEGLDGVFARVGTAPFDVDVWP